MAEIFRLGVLTSGDRQSGGGGSTVERVARDALEGHVGFDIGVVVCNNPLGTVGVYQKIEDLNNEFELSGDRRIDVVNISGMTHPGGKLERGQTLEESEAICRLMEERGIDFVAMLGYLKKLTGSFVEEWCWRPEYAEGDTNNFGKYHPKARILNNHPAILPYTADTHGHGAHERARQLFDKGLITHTSMTWQLASATVDGGPIIREELVSIQPEDSADAISDKVQRVEKEFTAVVLDDHLLRREQERLYRAG